VCSPGDRHGRLLDYKAALVRELDLPSSRKRKVAVRQPRMQGRECTREGYRNPNARPCRVVDKSEGPSLGSRARYVEMPGKAQPRCLTGRVTAQAARPDTPVWSRRAGRLHCTGHDVDPAGQGSQVDGVPASLRQSVTQVGRSTRAPEAIDVYGNSRCADAMLHTIGSSLMDSPA
jgi:hypothetical protein